MWAVRNSGAPFAVGQRIPAFRIAPSSAGLLPSRRARSTICRFREDKDKLAHKSLTKDESAKAEPSCTGSSENTDLVDWRNAWYAVHPLEDLPQDRPFPITVLGKRLVVWLDGDEQWRVFADSCPHRKVALSEGRIEADGTLQCSYHGWRFDGNGKCTTIPQLPEHENAARIASSAPACATAFPSQEADGMLWVWMDSSPEGSLLAASTPLSPSVGDFAAGSWMVRDVPMSYEVLVETNSDPSHQPFSHHGVEGSRSLASKPCFDRIEMLDKSGYWAIETSLRPAKLPGQWSRYRIDHSQLPSRFDLCIDRGVSAGDKSKPPPVSAMKLNTRIRIHPVPVTRTWSRMAVRVEYFGSDEKVRDRFTTEPIWKAHMHRNAVIDGDEIFLHQQDTLMQQGLFKPSDYFTPAKADKGVLAFWKFMQKYAPGGVDYYPHVAEPMVLSREAVLDRYNQHTKNCTACSAALKNVRLARWGAGGLIALSVCAMMVLLARDGSQLSLPMGGAAALGVAAAVAVHRLTKLEAEFVFKDYVHADR